MERCSNCGKTEEEVKLFDAVDLTEVIKMCERCALISHVPLVKRPSTNQLRDSEKPDNVRNRLMQMNHLALPQKKEKSLSEELNQLDEQPELQKPDDLVFKLVDNFHWVIQTERRRKGLNPKQLADSIGESENAIKLLEKGIVPNKSMNLITAIEQFLKIILIKRSSFGNVEVQKKPVSVGLDKDLAKDAKKDGSVKIRELQRQSEMIQHDFEFEKKSSEEVGKEQIENIGSEDTARIKKDIYKQAMVSNKNAPSIYDLMKKKEEKEKTAVTGKDIELAESAERKEFEM